MKLEDTQKIIQKKKIKDRSGLKAEEKFKQVALKLIGEIVSSAVKKERLYLLQKLNAKTFFYSTSIV
jgi:hypothetical protein